MRYSFYVYMNQMGSTLLEAASYLHDQWASPDAPSLINDCKTLLQTILSQLQKNRTSVTKPELFVRLQEMVEHCSRPVSQGWAEQFYESVQTLHQELKTGLEYKIKAVFLAELGEKWDALESVYQAFCARSDCDPLVVQLPVHRVVNQNGKQRTQVFYQDYLSGLGVPFEDYRNYHVKQDCPDLVFHTNPYESTIPSDYWPENLINFTRLVYIPYYTDFTVDSVVIQSNCQLPMALHAWRIASLSDKMVALHRKYAPRSGENLMVTGLPKWDHILQMKQPILEPEWEDKLRGKTVFLWNSHYNMGDNSTLLQNGEAIIELFSGRKDIALIWRPHPITETAFKLYNTDKAWLWEKLNQVVVESDNMVIDKNPLCDVGFQNSHALISDRSSMMVQYMLTGKPILWLKNGYRGCEPPVIDVNCLESARKPEEIVSFVERILNGEDRTKEQRRRVIQQDMALADGKCGERVCLQTIQDMLAEDLSL